ncbi:probable pseudouridine-5'-phosphatase isoform X1 [Sitophilus oryzae]|uniref:Probable pseudouridine-5'-phosphatase isoform X1 n=1 Tax=Sitophilus oryzae TaxID=7048 RepID=A0A6J2XI22_SITOR|nr:probable pseudouridine-5'-phosphatase isoform X1 [Sitophilus oryzae]
MSKYKQISHVIFDMDGVLLDTENVYKNAISCIAKRFGKVYTADIVAKVIGTLEKESARIAVTEMKLPIPVEEFRHEFRTLSHGFFAKHHVPLMPGAKKLVHHLSSNKIPISVATSSSIDSFELKTKKHKEFFKLFDHVVCGGTDPEVKQGKPSPDIFLISASRFPDAPKPEKCLVVEDSPNGVQAAISAGMQVVMIPDHYVPEERRRDATLVVSSLDLIPLEKFGLPSLK